MGAALRRVRLLFAEGGGFHQVTVEIPGDVLSEYERLIDCLREDPAVLERLHVDVGRLCVAYLLDE